jgi:hypothetical protein
VKDDEEDEDGDCEGYRPPRVAPSDAWRTSAASRRDPETLGRLHAEVELLVRWEHHHRKRAEGEEEGGHRGGGRRREVAAMGRFDGEEASAAQEPRAWGRTSDAMYLRPSRLQRGKGLRGIFVSWLISIFFFVLFSSIN